MWHIARPVGSVAIGVVYCLAGGFCIAAAATFIAATLAFLGARSIFQPFIARAISRRPSLTRLDEAIARGGWRIVGRTRMSPIIPFTVSSYALGLAALKLHPYLIGTLASTPALLGYIALGSSVGSGLH